MGAGDDSGTKEFDPTPRKLQRLRQQGQVAKSRDLGQLFTFIVGAFLLIMNRETISHLFQEMFVGLFAAVSQKSLTEIGVGYILMYSLRIYALIIFPLMFAIAIVAILADILQVGFIFTTEPLAFNLGKLNPANYFKNTFGPRGIVELLKQLLKVGVLGFVGYRVIERYWTQIINLLSVDTVGDVGELLAKILYDFTFESAIALVVVTLADFLFQRFRFTQDNRMTRKELMDEFKQDEGDPMMKQQRRALARRLTQRRQMAVIPEADFITTNPSKIAVAIKYQSGIMSAPRVIAKGSDAFAWRIIQLGREHKIPIIENVPLARALFRLVKVDQEIPPELYRAVAEVLLFAYQVKAKAKAAFK
ncbi:MAG: EscU/YscU/HrcU family type III secretion system export apparatus switch protein [Candidatus Caenarcaniphilales bacterium]|nr:EscU/YscU/HrcU family type III secretion system export apparatus switch protein [Candidatus Caenarcaniphilales bacterium]